MNRVRKVARLYEEQRDEIDKLRAKNKKLRAKRKAKRGTPR